MQANFCHNNIPSCLSSQLKSQSVRKRSLRRRGGARLSFPLCTFCHQEEETSTSATRSTTYIATRSTSYIATRSTSYSSTSSLSWPLLVFLTRIASTWESQRWNREAPEGRGQPAAPFPDHGEHPQPTTAKTTTTTTTTTTATTTRAAAAQLASPCFHHCRGLDLSQLRDTKCSKCSVRVLNAVWVQPLCLDVCPHRPGQGRGGSVEEEEGSCSSATYPPEEDGEEVGEEGDQPGVDGHRGETGRA